MNTMHVYEILWKLHTLLNDLKGFRAGHTSRNHSSMIVEKDNKVYKLSLEELGEGTVEDYMNQL
jgi:hypothetical protein